MLVSCYARRRPKPASVGVMMRSLTIWAKPVRVHCPAELTRNGQVATERRHDGTQAAQPETMSSEAPNVRVRRGPKIVERAKRA